MKRRKSDQSKLKEGRGQGIGKDYLPFDDALSFPSRSGHKRIPGIKINRTHHYFSDLEKNYLSFFEYSDNVIDIREQFPLLPLTETQEIAKSLNISHPKDSEMVQHVMRTDYRISFKDSKDMIFTIKLSTDLTNRVIQKFEIERVYWQRRDIKWFILTEREIDPIILNNLNRLRENFNNDTEHLQEFIKELKPRFVKKSAIIRDVISETSYAIRITKPMGEKLLLYLLAHKRITFSLRKPYNIKMLVSEFNFSKL